MARGETAAGEPLHVTLGLGALAEEVVVPERAAVPVPAGLPPAQAALLGCAVLTGAGAVRNTARVAAGESVAVIGLGGVGLAVLGAARGPARHRCSPSPWWKPSGSWRWPPAPSTSCAPTGPIMPWQGK